MAKPESKKAKAAPEVIELRYTLAELPSSQHRAGLAGLVFMIDWLKRQRPKKVGICEYLDLDARGVSVKIDLPGLIQLFDQVYGASHEEQRSTSPWKGQEPLRIDEDTIEERGKTKTKTKKYYVYPVVVPRGAFLADIRWDQTVDKAGNGPWIKLWRDMVWTIMRGVPAQRRPFNERATASFDKDAHEAWAMLRKPDIDERIKRRAADKLITVWDDAHLEIDDFAPLLESAWHARNRITSDFGCLVGATETFRLVCEDCSPEVLEFFARDDRSFDESAAFEEFLFNMTHEELDQLRKRMRDDGLRSVSSAWASKVLGRHIDELEHSHEIDPIALYRSYNRRQLAADFRVMSGSPGPRRTAEGYLMVDLLDRG